VHSSSVSAVHNLHDQSGVSVAWKQKKACLLLLLVTGASNSSDRVDGQLSVIVHSNWVLYYALADEMLLELSTEMPPAALLSALNGLQQVAVQHLDGMVEVGDLLVGGSAAAPVNRQ
jgi:hypothetical protein